MFINNVSLSSQSSKSPKHFQYTFVVLLQVLYEVGQIVKVNQITGVIVAWDEECKAPPEFFKTKPNEYQTDIPHYLVLMDSIEAGVVYDQYRYLAQNEIEPARSPKRVTSVTSVDYFENYQNGRYQLRPWLQEIYPRG